MLRSGLIYLSGAGWARNLVMNVGITRRMARRFVAGETLDETVAACRELNQEGLTATLNYLGESVERAEDTEAVVEEYQRIARRIHDEGLQASISIKPTHLGLDLSEELCQTNLRHILTTAQECGVSVTIDMESSKVLEVTLKIYRTMRDEYGFDNVGTVTQSYLRRTADDMRELAAEGAHIRLVKGAYLEPPDIAFPDKADVDRNFIELTHDFLSANDTAYLCIATHDENIIQDSQQFAEQNAIPTSRYEFQMLYGVRQQRQRELVEAGYAMRVYVPYGEAWYPYFMRRLAERPANLWFFVKNFFGG